MRESHCYVPRRDAAIPCAPVAAQDPNIIITVDNCYGEFTEEREPCDVGADLCMGSLIKNGGACVRVGGSCAALSLVVASRQPEPRLTTPRAAQAARSLRAAGTWLGAPS